MEKSVSQNLLGGEALRTFGADNIRAYVMPSSFNSRGLSEAHKGVQSSYM